MIERANQAAGFSLPEQNFVAGVKGDAGRKRMRRVLIAAKIGFTILAFVLMARTMDPATLLERVRSTDPVFFIVAILLAVIQIPLTGLRWRLIVQTMSPGPSSVPAHTQFQQITYIGQFFGQVLPFVAGDGLRVLLLREAGAPLRVAFKSTLLDRGIAALTLFVLALSGILQSPVLAAAHGYLMPITLFIVVGLVGIIMALLSAPLLARFGTRWRVTSAVTEALLDLRRILLDWRYSLRIIGLCILVHVISMTVFWLLARGQHLPITVGDAAIVVPLILLVSMMPVAIAGWGVREGFVVALLGAAGISSESALLLSVSFGTVFFLAALPGLAVLVLSTRASAQAGISQEI
jgi:uncharacterized membrane protein YbhN (UPF0104 family)